MYFRDIPPKSDAWHVASRWKHLKHLQLLLLLLRLQRVEQVLGIRSEVKWSALELSLSCAFGGFGGFSSTGE